MPKFSILKIVTITVLVLGAIVLIVGGILYWLYGQMKADTIRENSVLEPDSQPFNRWLNSSTPAYRRVYIFAVLNGDDVARRAAKPVVAERGPYTFRIHDRRTDVAFSSSEPKFQQLSYSLDRRLEFVAELSNGTLNDSVTVINIPAVTLATWARNGPIESQWLLAEMLLGKEKLFHPVTVKELLFGYVVPGWNQKLRELMWRLFNVTLPKDSRFVGLLNDADSQQDSNYTIWTGVDGLSRVRDIKMFNGQSALSIWNSAESNSINGTDGSGWHPYIADSATLDLFDRNWCRSIRLTKSSEWEAVKQSSNGTADDQLDTDIFVQLKDVYNNSEYGGGFCVDVDEPCLAAGSFDVSRCRDDYPLVWSEPHFYQADDSYVKIADGLEPNATRHRSFVTVEALTGSVVTSSRKLQMNVYTRRLEGYPVTFHMIFGFVFPVLWLSEDTEMMASDRHQLRDEVVNPYNRYASLQSGMIIMMIIGAVLFAVGLLHAIAVLLISWRPNAQGENQPLLDGTGSRTTEN